MKQKKRVFIFIIAAALVIAAAVLVALWKSEKNYVVDRAVVLNVTEGINGWHSLFLFTEPHQNTASDLMTAGINSNTKLIDAKGKTIKITDIQPGQLIELFHSGLILESYPGQYAEVYKVKVLGAADENFFQQGKDRMNEWNKQFN